MSRRVGNPADKSGQAPSGVTGVAVPAEVIEGEAEYVSSGLPPGGEIRPSEVPTSLDSRPEISRRARELSEADFSQPASIGGVTLVAAGAHFAEGARYRAELVAGSLHFEPLEGGNEFILPPSSLFSDSRSSVLTRVTVAYDQFADRFLILALEPSEAGSEPVGSPSRILIAVSDDFEPDGEWYIASVDLEGTELDPSQAKNWQGLAVDADGVYLVADVSTADGVGGPSRIWVIRKGLKTSGFYLGGTAIIGVY